MHKSFPHFCIEQHFSYEEMKALRELARDENPINAEPFEGASLHSTLWQVGKTLRVKFLDGSPSLQQRIISTASFWCHYANITLAVTNDSDAEIRISFMEGSSWSAIGIEARLLQKFSLHEPTMNFGWLTNHMSDAQFSNIVLHEFGHALGMIHEHQSPTNTIQWNRQVVIDDLSSWPYYWSLSHIETNIFHRFGATETQFTTFDPQSIMIYEIPARWITKGTTSMKNSTLSGTDKNFIRTCYPR